VYWQADDGFIQFIEALVLTEGRDDRYLDIVAEGGYLYAQRASVGLEIFDLTNPRDPAMVGVFDTSTRGSTSIAIDPPSLFVRVKEGDAPTTRALTVINAGGADGLNFSIHSTAPWLTAAPERGGPLEISESSIATVEIDPAALSPGVHESFLDFFSFEADNSPVATTVTLTVARVGNGVLPEPWPPPIVDVESIEGGGTATLVLHDDSHRGEPLRFEIDADAPWIAASPRSGEIPPGESVEIELTFSTFGLMAGRHVAAVSIVDLEAPGDPLVGEVGVNVIGPDDETPLGLFDFRAGAEQSWLGVTFEGFGGEFLASETFGLCMTVPASGDNYVAWVGPSNYVQLVDSMVYRARVAISTSQSDVDAIPFFDFSYDNFQSPGGSTPPSAYGFLNYGGSRWIWDASGQGGAQGIGRAQGRDDFEFWFAPVSLDLPQWTTKNDYGSAAFSAEADPINDMRFMFRVLDLGGGSDPLFASDDSGTICIERVYISMIPLEALRDRATTIYAPALNDGSNEPGFEAPESPERTHFPQSHFNAAMFAQVEADIIDGEWRVSMGEVDPADGYARATLGPDEVAAGPVIGVNGLLDPMRFFPIEWEQDAIYMIRARMRSTLPPPTPEIDPPDLIAINHETYTGELGGVDWVTSGADLNGAAAGDGGGMMRAGSPRRRDASGPPTPEYLAFFHGNNATLSPLLNAARWKAQIEAFNRADLGGGPTSGQDPFAVELLAVDRIVGLELLEPPGE
jgi:hypothetical protein